MRRVVLDASAAVRVVLGLPPVDDLLAVLGSTEIVMAPELYSSEVANALWKHVVFGDLEMGEATELLEDAMGLVDTQVDARELATEALVAAERYHHPAYDMLYAVLGRRYGCWVITMDKRFRAILEAMAVPVFPPESEIPAAAGTA